MGMPMIQGTGRNWIFLDDHGRLGGFMGPFADQARTAGIAVQLNERAKRGTCYRLFQEIPLTEVPVNRTEVDERVGVVGGHGAK